MEFLKGFPPEVAVAVAILWILREVFGFVSKRDAVTKIDDHAERVESAVLDQVKEICSALSRNIERSTEVQAEMVLQMKLLVKDFDELRDEVRRPRA